MMARIHIARIVGDLEQQSLPKGEAQQLVLRRSPDASVCFTSSMGAATLLHPDKLRNTHTRGALMDELYDIRISRGDSDAGIGGEEWLALIRSDDSLLVRDTLEGRNPMTGEVMLINQPLTAEWIKHPDQRLIHFLFEDGEIVARELDQPSIQKALEIAAGLNAKLVRRLSD